MKRDERKKDTGSRRRKKNEAEVILEREADVLKEKDIRGWTFDRPKMTEEDEVMSDHVSVGGSERGTGSVTYCLSTACTV